MILASQNLQGLLLPVVLVFMVLLVNDRRLMGDRRNGRVANVLAWSAVGVVIALTSSCSASRRSDSSGSRSARARGARARPGPLALGVPRPLGVRRPEAAGRLASHFHARSSRKDKSREPTPAEHAECFRTGRERQSARLVPYSAAATVTLCRWTQESRL